MCEKTDSAESRLELISNTLDSIMEIEVQIRKEIQERKRKRAHWFETHKAWMTAHSGNTPA